MSWKAEDEKYLRVNWKTENLPQIIAFLGKTEDSVIRKAGRMGLNICKEPNNLIKRKWTMDENQYMISNYNLLSVEILMKDLNRSRNSILKRAQYLNLTIVLKYWTKDEINYLEENWGIMSIKSISRKLKRSMDAVSLKACQISLREQILANGYFFTPRCVSEILNINIRTIYNCMFNELLHFRKFNLRKKTKYQISVDSFLDFLENNLNIWDSRVADIQTIKSHYCSYSITTNDIFSVNSSLPNWLQNKIQEDSKV